MSLRNKVLDKEADNIAVIPQEYTRTNTGRTATDLVLSHVLEGLVEGTYIPGQRLNAKQLTAELDVTIVPVREALHFLAGEGLVELLPLRGAQIQTLNQDEIIRWWDIFSAISKMAIVAAPKHLSENPSLCLQLDEAMESIDSLIKTDNYRRFIISLLAVHKVLNEITGMKEVDEATRRLQAVFWCSFLPDYIPLEIYAQEFADHYRQMINLIKIGAGEAAYTFFEYHVAWSSDIMRGKRPTPKRTWVKP